MADFTPLIDLGLPFETNDLGFLSSKAALDDLSLKLKGSIFESPDLSQNIEDLAPPWTSAVVKSHFEFERDLQPGDQKGATRNAEPAGAPVPTSRQSLSSEDTTGGDDASLWQLDDLADTSNFPKHSRTWEAFERQQVPTLTQARYLSEADPLTTDAVFDGYERKTGQEHAILPHGLALRALTNLALGRSSVLFQWLEPKQAFEQVLNGMTLSGMSKMSSASIFAEIQVYGATIVKLRSFSETSSPRMRAHIGMIALNRCVAEVLDTVDESIAQCLKDLKSVNQLRQLIATPSRLLEALFSLVQIARDCHSDEALISALSDQVSLLVYTAPQLCPIFQDILERVSSPWLERLTLDLGLGGEQPSVSASDTDSDCPDVLERARSYFLSGSDSLLIQQTKNALQLLRKNMLGRRDVASYPNMTRTTRRDPDSTRDQTSRSFGTRSRADATSRSDEHTMPNEQVDTAQSSNALQSYGWHNEPSQEEYIHNLGEMMSKNSLYDEQRQSLPTGSLRSRVRNALESSKPSQPHVELPLDTYLDTSILRRLRPQILEQHDRSNLAAFRLLLIDCKLLEHLDLQRSFQLLGSGDFIMRLSTALFSPEVQSAERKRGTVPNAQVMGLRLDANRTQRWPPASSELRLALTGVLAESYASLTSTDSSFNPPDIPGSLSFAIRELPDEEIDRLTDPRSIHALDFLRLQYTPPEPLDVIITTTLLDHYDQIFRFLLKFMRLSYITKQLQVSLRTTTARHPHASPSPAHTIHHLVTTLMTHFMDIGISAPWLNFRSSLTDFHSTLSQNQTSHVTVTQLHALHATCLATIRSRLYLQRRHTAIHAAILDVLSSCMTTAAALTARADHSHTTRPRSLSGLAAAPLPQISATLRAPVDRLCALLQASADRPPRSLDRDGAEDAEMCRLLLAKLQWNRFL